MSSGRLFLDRVGRHQSPSPLHRRDQNKLIARSDGTIYHRTVSSVLSGCLNLRDKRNSTLRTSTVCGSPNRRSGCSASDQDVATGTSGGAGRERETSVDG